MPSHKVATVVMYISLQKVLAARGVSGRLLPVEFTFKMDELDVETGKWTRR